MPKSAILLSLAVWGQAISWINKFEVADIYETSVCPLAKVMRYELRKRGITSLKVVYSKEPARTPIEIKRITAKLIVFVRRNSTKMYS